jgi:crossover junction endodeoxyribonuclease RuvC
MPPVGITPEQFKNLESRLGRKRTAAPLMPTATASTPAAAKQVILGIDPSLRGTGFGVIRLARPHSVMLSCGTISCRTGWDRSRCLLQILQSLRDAIKKHHPEVCAIEGLFYAQNLQTALIMGEARGVALVAAAEAGMEIYEIAPRKMKQAIVGYGAAQKTAVAKMVQRLLDLPEPPAPDAADALALALAFSQEHGRYSLTGGPKKV